MGRYEFVKGENPKSRCLVIIDKDMVPFLAKDIAAVVNSYTENPRAINHRKPVYVITENKRISALRKVLDSQLNPKYHNKYMAMGWESRFSPGDVDAIYFGARGRPTKLENFIPWVAKNYPKANRIVIFCSLDDYDCMLQTALPEWIQEWNVLRMVPEKVGTKTESEQLDDILKELQTL